MTLKRERPYPFCISGYLSVFLFFCKTYIPGDGNGQGFPGIPLDACEVVEPAPVLPHRQNQHEKN